MSAWRLPLPLHVVAPPTFVKSGVARAAIVFHGPGGSVLARLKVTGEEKRRLLGVVPVATRRRLTLEDPEGDRSLSGTYRDGVGLAYDPPTPSLELEHGDLGRWSGFQARLEDASGEKLGSVRMRGSLSNDFQLQGTGGAVAATHRLDRRARRAAKLRVPFRRVALRIEGAADLDARLLVVWGYAIAMADAHR